MDCLIPFHCLAELCEAANGAKVRFHYRTWHTEPRIHPRCCFVFRLCSSNHYRFQSWVLVLLSEAGGDCIVIPAGCLQFMYTEEAKHRLVEIQLLPLDGPRCCLLGFFFHLFMRFTFQTHTLMLVKWDGHPWPAPTEAEIGPPGRPG